jgi:hypothetical protein
LQASKGRKLDAASGDTCLIDRRRIWPAVDGPLSRTSGARATPKKKMMAAIAGMT